MVDLRFKKHTRMSWTKGLRNQVTGLCAYCCSRFRRSLEDSRYLRLDTRPFRYLRLDIRPYENARKLQLL